MKIIFLYGRCLVLVLWPSRGHWDLPASLRMWGSVLQPLAEWCCYSLCENFIPCISLISAAFKGCTRGKGERWFICDDIWPEPDLIVLAVGLLSNSCGSPDLTQAKCHMLHLQMGICSSRAASLPLQWTFSQWDRGVSTTLFKGRGNFWWKWI